MLKTIALLAVVFVIVGTGVGVSLSNALKNSMVSIAQSLDEIQRR